MIARYLTPAVHDHVLGHDAVSGCDVRVYTAGEAGDDGAPPLHVFATARALADETAAELQASYPDLFGAFVPEHDLYDAFRLALTLRLAIDEIPRLLGFLAHPGRRVGLTVLVNFSLSEAQVRRVEELAGVQRASELQDVVCLSTATDKLLRVLQHEVTGDPPSERSSQAADAEPGCAIVLCGSETERAHLSALVGILRDRGRGVLVLAKNDRPENLRLCTDLATLGGGGVLRAEAFAALPLTDPSRRCAAPAVERLRAQHEAIGGDRRKGFRLTNLATFRSLLRTALAVEALVAAVKPTLVAGALDRTVYGALMSSPGRGYATVDLQHGTVLPMHVMDLLRFDLTLMWNRRSRMSLISDGYPPSARVKVIGNPNWDALRGRSGDTPAARDLAEWKGTGTLVVAFPQPAKGPFLSRALLRRVDDWLAAAVAARDDVKLLVKLRPREDRAGADPFASLASAGRVRTMTAREISLADALSCADLAVSVYSTALADAVAAGVPAVSVDPQGIVAALGFDFRDAVRVCATALDLHSAVADAATGGGHAATIDDDFLPRFTDSYPQRLHAALDSAGLI